MNTRPSKMTDIRKYFVDVIDVSDKVSKGVFLTAVYKSDASCCLG